MAQTSVAELEADCAELRSMMSKVTRPNVRKELQRALDVLEADLRREQGGQASDEAPNRKTAEKVWADLEVRHAAKQTGGASAALAAPAAAPPAATAAAPAAAAPAATAAAPKEAPHKPVPVAIKSAGPWTEITTFALELGGYNSPVVTVDLRLKGVEALPAENVTCDFTTSSFDLKVVGLDGVNYRFLRTNLDKDIVPSSSSIRVKKNHVIINLQKVKTELGYDSWTDLVSKRPRKSGPSSQSKDNPTDSIMGMMQDLYEDGDDGMKKMIGEAMYKARRGEKYDPQGPDAKLGDDLDDI